MKKPTWLLKLEYGMAHQPPKKNSFYETFKDLSKKPETYLLSLSALAVSFMFYEGHHNLSKSYSIYGMPISVSAGYTAHGGDIIVQMRSAGKDVIGMGYIAGAEELLHTEALIKSEISDGDNEPIELFGYNEDGIFKTMRIRVHDKTVECAKL